MDLSVLFGELFAKKNSKIITKNDICISLWFSYFFSTFQWVWESQDFPCLVGIVRLILFSYFLQKGKYVKMSPPLLNFIIDILVPSLHPCLLLRQQVSVLLILGKWIYHFNFFISNKISLFCQFINTYIIQK